MKNLKRNYQNRRLMYSLPSLVILTLVTILLARGAVRIVGKERESQGRLENLEARVSELVLREQKLKDGIESLKTTEGVESEIRERFSVTTEGEHLAVIVDPEISATSTKEDTRPWYKRLWSAIIGDE